MKWASYAWMFVIALGIYALVEVTSMVLMVIRYVCN